MRWNNWSDWDYPVSMWQGGESYLNLIITLKLFALTYTRSQVIKHFHMNDLLSFPHFMKRKSKKHRFHFTNDGIQSPGPTAHKRPTQDSNPGLVLFQLGSCVPKTFCNVGQCVPTWHQTHRHNWENDLGSDLVRSSYCLAQGHQSDQGCWRNVLSFPHSTSTTGICNSVSKESIRFYLSVQ